MKFSVYKNLTPNDDKETTRPFVVRFENDLKAMFIGICAEVFKEAGYEELSKHIIESLNSKATEVIHEDSAVMISMDSTLSKMAKLMSSKTTDFPVPSISEFKDLIMKASNEAPKKNKFDTTTLSFSIAELNQLIDKLRDDEEETKTPIKTAMKINLYENKEEVLLEFDSPDDELSIFLKNDEVKELINCLDRALMHG
jgi:hypothetical protein